MNFFQQLDGRIFSISLSGITDNAFLFDPKPVSFYLQSWAIVIAILGLVLTVAAIWFLKKRRDRLYVPKERRHVFTRHAKINIIFWAVYLVLILLRTQGVMYLSMRFLQYLMLFLVLANSLVAVALSFRREPVAEEVEPITGAQGEDAYHKYLPKKKKKK
jgi:hypothetical protein